jgi:hypothetical protein
MHIIALDIYLRVPPRAENREAGVNPARTRHCKRIAAYAANANHRSTGKVYDRANPQVRRPALGRIAFAE